MKSIKILICIFAVSAIGFAFTYDSSNPLDKNDWPRKRSTLVGNNIGDQAPELAVKNPDGKLIKLSSLKGQYVLIDFWASWCGPCRRENPNVVAAYAKYKEAKFKKAKGFEIYSVSLDKNMNAWKQAIGKDRLTWNNHVCDFGGWQSKAAKAYGVRSIPASFLIDPDGIIVAKNLRGQGLHIELDKYVAKL